MACVTRNPGPIISLSRALVGSVLCFMLSGCIILCPSKRHSTATGWITGKVVDSLNHPVRWAMVSAVYVRGWTTFCPPVPNWFVVGTTKTDDHGQFRVFGTKRVDLIDVVSRDSHEEGDLLGVALNQNIVRIRQLSFFSPKEPPNAQSGAKEK